MPITFLLSISAEVKVLVIILFLVAVEKLHSYPGASSMASEIFKLKFISLLHGQRWIMLAPSNSLSILPLSNLCFTLRSLSESSDSVLCSIDPSTIVDISSWPSVDTLSVLLVILEFTNVNSTIWPIVSSTAVKSVFLPFTVVLFAVRPHVCAFSVKHIIFPGA